MRPSVCSFYTRQQAVVTRARRNSAKKGKVRDARCAIDVGAHRRIITALIVIDVPSDQRSREKRIESKSNSRVTRVSRRRERAIDVNAGVSRNKAKPPSLYWWNYGKRVQSVENVFNRCVIELNLQRALGVQFHTSRILFIIHYSLNEHRARSKRFFDRSEEDITNFLAMKSVQLASSRVSFSKYY